MNRASALLLRQIVEPGQGPWVVGDLKQAIYRFRGGSPLNMARFEDDFPGASSTDLGVNYRSGGKIVRGFQTFEKDMAAAMLAPVVKLKANRGEGAGAILFEVASDFPSECEGIARTINGAVLDGGRYGDHAILARSHTTLARLAKHLERRGVPCLYFGNFFEREEVRNLLSLLSLGSERTGIGLLRVSQFEQYSIPYEDVRLVFDWQRAHDLRLLAALKQIGEIEGLSEAGREGLGRLSRDIADVDFPMSAHRFLLSFLFRRDDHLRPLLQDKTVAGQQRRLAIYQLLQFAFAFRSRPGKDPKYAFLEHIRTLEILDEEKQLRQLPAAASDIDAVRMMTVHASKGLQFPIVHIPSVTSRHFPVNRADLVTLPPGLIDDGVLMSREAEEESLFYVALSRAKDVISLSRAPYHGGGGWSNVAPSPYLFRIAAHLPKSPDSPPAWVDPGDLEPDEPPFVPPAQPEAWSATEIETYLGCPRRFYYESALGLHGSALASPYLNLNKAVRSTIAWMQSPISDTERRTGAQTRFAADWEQCGLQGHALETIYKTAAEAMLATAGELVTGQSLEQELTLVVSGDVSISCRADHIVRTRSGIDVFRFKLNPLAVTEKYKARYGVIQAALHACYPGVPVEFEHVSLLSGERRNSTLKAKKLDTEIANLTKAIKGITSGHFQATPNDHDCPRCPFFFVCPSHAALRRERPYRPALAKSEPAK